MKEISLTINGREVKTPEGRTILEAAGSIGVDIPTLCHDERVETYGSCGICVVECEGAPRLLRACSTMAADGMIIHTESERVKKSRKTALELLLSDHTGDCRPPCLLACPAGTDCQGYVGLIANGEYGEALRLVMDKIPLPGSIGRVCPHPCEEACRRKMVEEPVSIAALKQFVADRNIDNVRSADTAPDTGKSAAVVGGGPGGLSAAYFLRRMGHAVTVYDAMPEMGGMLRYGIPEYRLPKKYLSSEIETIHSMGIEFRNNIRLGRDFGLDDLRKNYGAVVLAVGAWTSSGLRCPGEELEGVVGGIDFLRETAMGNAPDISGKNVAVVGGGNTAMDCARTAVRLGAENVYIIYRRTRAEMPAEDIEIEEAIEEGVSFKFLTNPIEVSGENGKVKSLHLQIMELGEPDASGRRAPVPVSGKEETITADIVISAIGQKPDTVSLEGVALTKWGTIAADEGTFRTSLEGVFAVGDATNNGADIAITAIGEAGKAATVIDAYLNGAKIPYTGPFLVKSEPEEGAFASYNKIPREKMYRRSPEERRRDFLEVNHGFTEEQAKNEAARCLECGCRDYFECKLIDYANRFGGGSLRPERLAGEAHRRGASGDDHPYIERNPDKCILCGLCVRICGEVAGVGALGLVDRGFDTVVKPALDAPLRETGCISCGLCVHACPTGALTEKTPVEKQVPVRELCTDTVCSFCSIGCETRLTHTGGLLLRSLPIAGDKRGALLCAKGRFGFGEPATHRRLTKPLVKTVQGAFKETSFENAYAYAAGRIRDVIFAHGPGSVAVAVSDRYTNEDAALVTDFAKRTAGADRVYCFNMGGGGLEAVLGADVSTAGLDALAETGLVILAGCDITESHSVAGMRLRRAASGGVRVIVLNGFESGADDFAYMKLDPGGDLSILKQILKAVTELSPAGRDLPGYGALCEYLKGVEISGPAMSAAVEYISAEKAVIVFDQNAVTRDASVLLADIALCAGKANTDRNSPGTGIIRLWPGANTQGLADMGVRPGEELAAKLEKGDVKGLVIFGEDVPGIDTGGLDFLAVQELAMTSTAEKTDIVFPACGFAEGGGSFTDFAGIRRELRAAIPPLPGVTNAQIIEGLSLALRPDEPVRPGGLRAASKPHSLVLPEGDEFARSVPNTNALCNSFVP